MNLVSCCRYLLLLLLSVTSDLAAPDGMVLQHLARPPPPGQQDPPIRPHLPQHSWTEQNPPNPQHLLPGTWPSHHIPLPPDLGPQQHSLLSSKEHDVGEVSENSSSVGKKEQIIEHVAIEEEDPTDPVLVDDTCDGRSGRLSVL